MTLPRKTDALNGDCLRDTDWDAMVDIATVMDASGYSARTPYSYLLFTDGAGNYYAKNGATGLIEFTSTDASDLLNTVCNLDQGMIFIAKGTYNLSDSVIIGKRIVFAGTGDGTRFNMDTTQHVPAFVLDEQVVLRDFALSTIGSIESTNILDVGVKVNGSFITYPNGQYSTLTNVRVSRMGIGLLIDTGWNNDYYKVDLYNNYIGLYITSDELYEEAPANSQIQNIWGGKIESSRSYPVFINYGKYVTFYKTYISSSKDSIYLDNFRGIKFDRCSIEVANPGVTAVYTPVSDPDYRQELEFDQAQFDLWGSASDHANGLNLYNVTNVNIIRPTIANLYPSRYFLNATACTYLHLTEPIKISVTGTMFENQIPQQDMYYGIVTFSQAGEWSHSWAHNLGFTPTTVVVTTASIDAASGVYLKTSWDATYIYVGYTGGLPPNGTNNLTYSWIAGR